MRLTYLCMSLPSLCWLFPPVSIEDGLPCGIWNRIVRKPGFLTRRKNNKCTGTTRRCHVDEMEFRRLPVENGVGDLTKDTCGRYALKKTMWYWWKGHVFEDSGCSSGSTKIDLGVSVFFCWWLYSSPLHSFHFVAFQEVSGRSFKWPYARQKLRL